MDGLSSPGFDMFTGILGGSPINGFARSSRLHPQFDADAEAKPRTEDR